MPWPCTAKSASAKSRPTAPIPWKGRFTWSCCCNPRRLTPKWPPRRRKDSGMKKALLVAAVVTLVIPFAFPAQSKTVSYKSGEETVQGELFTPAGRGPLPALVVIHEWWGLNDWVKQQAGKLSEEGYVTLAIDLYRGKVASTPEEAHEIMRGVPEDRARRDLR